MLSDYVQLVPTEKKYKKKAKLKLTLLNVNVSTLRTSSVNSKTGVAGLVTGAELHIGLSLSDVGVEWIGVNGVAYH